jgi:hypothetical protein
MGWARDTAASSGLSTTDGLGRILLDFLFLIIILETIRQPEYLIHSCFFLKKTDFVVSNP